MFQDGPVRTISSASPRKRGLSSLSPDAARKAITPKLPSNRAFPPGESHAESPALTARCVSRQHKMRAGNTSPNGFPLNDFKFLLTLFSKCFSSFLHSTCSLSVSHQYLALDGIYHPIWSALPSKPTLRKRTKRRGPKTGLSPSLVLAFLPELDPVPAFAPLDYNSRRILRLSSSLFSRPYWGNPGWFLFLGLVICLNSAGPLA